MLERDIAIGNVSVCLSVCHSVRGARLLWLHRLLAKTSVCYGNSNSFIVAATLHVVMFQCFVKPPLATARAA